MRALLAVAALACCTLPALAETTTFTTPGGRTTGYAVREGNTVRYLNPQFRTQRTDTIQPNGTVVSRDRQFRTLGIAKPNN